MGADSRLPSSRLGDLRGELCNKMGGLCNKREAVQLDPRHRNEKFDTTTPGRYLATYTERLSDAMARVDEDAMEQTILRISEAAAAGNRIYSIGNGGSAAIADHLCCDMTKGAHVPGHRAVDAVSLRRTSRCIRPLRTTSASRASSPGSCACWGAKATF